MKQVSARLFTVSSLLFLMHPHFSAILPFLLPFLARIFIYATLPLSQGDADAEFMVKVVAIEARAAAPRN
jgi:hypothetical protein